MIAFFVFCSSFCLAEPNLETQPTEEIRGVERVVDEIVDSANVAERLSPVFKRLEQRLYEGLSLLPILIIVLIFMIFAIYIARKVASTRKITAKITKNPFLQDILSQSLRVIIIIGALVLSLEMLGATALIGAVLGAAGVFGLAISFAFRDIIENYIAGIILSVKTPFLPGDHVNFSGVDGIVVKMTTRATIVKTFDGNNISIPNSIVFKEKIENYSTIPQRRFKFTVGIDCVADPDFGRKVGLDAIKSLSGVEKKPGPFALIDGLGDSSVNLSFYGWVDQDNEDFEQVRSSAIRVTKIALEDNGVEMPQPGYDLNLKNATFNNDIDINQPSAKKHRDLKNYSKEEFGGSQKKETDLLIQKEKKAGDEADLLTN